MKANELMIGDWVQEVVSKHPFRIEAILPAGFMRYTSDGSIAVPYDWSEIEPIPLTPEILEKNGFTCDENIAKLVERDDTKNILWSARYSFFTGIMGVVNKVTDEKVRARCYSVHELQKIFRLLEIEKKIII